MAAVRPGHDRNRERMTRNDQAVQAAVNGPTDDPVELIEVLVVRVAGDRYAVEVGHAGRVVDIAAAQRVPNTPVAVLGVGRVEGRVTVLIDVETVLAGGSREGDRDAAGQYLVSDRGEDRNPVALRIGGVEGIDTYPLAAVEAPGTADGNEAFLRGVIDPQEAEEDPESGGGRLPLLDVEAVFRDSVEGIDTDEWGSQPE